MQPDVFRDGVQLIRGTEITRGVYRRGRWQGCTYARFAFELCHGPDGVHVTQMLPWVPEAGFFDVNLRLLIGMSLSEFDAMCVAEGLTGELRKTAFVERFRGVAFEADVRQRDKWLNVWQLVRRVG